MNGNDRKWFEQFEKRIFSEIGSVKEQITIRHGFFLENYEKSCQDIDANAESIKKVKKETTFSRLVQRNPVKSVIIFVISVIIIKTIFNWEDVIILWQKTF